MNEFRSRLRSAIDGSKYSNSLRSLALDAKLGERTISNILNNKAIDDSKTGPGLFTMSRVADHLGVSLDWLAGRADFDSPPSLGDKEFALALTRFAASSAGQYSKGNHPPTPQAIQRIYVRGGGRIEAFKDVLKYCDRYHCLDSDAQGVSVKEVGSESLAAVTMGTDDATVLQIALNTVPDHEFREKLLHDHLETQRRGCLCTIEELNIQMPNRPVRVKMDYIRVLLHVSDAGGCKEILSYSSLIA